MHLRLASKMTPVESLTAVAAIIAALGAFTSAVASVISAVNASRGKKMATETRELVRTFVAQQQSQRQDVHVHVTASSVTAQAAPKELTFPPEAVPAIRDAPLPSAAAGLPSLAPARIPPEKAGQ